MKVYMMEQGSLDWHKVRRGIPTASRFDCILTPKTMQPSAQQDDYIAELLGDRYSEFMPERAESYMTKPMLWGVETEPQARAWYSMTRNVDAQRVGFITTDDGRFGCSPDALIGAEGSLELKCPLAKTQVSYLLKPSKLLFDYRCQVHGALIVAERQWVDLCSYAIGFDPVIIRVTPDAFTDKLRAVLNDFWTRYEMAHAALTRKDQP